MGSDKIEIRKGSFKDAAILARIGRMTFTETFGHYFRDPKDLLNYLNSTFSLEKMESGLLKEDNRFWLAYVNGVVAGYAKLKLKSGNEIVQGTNIGQLQKIYVLNDFHSMLVGQRLQEELLKVAIENKTDLIWLSVLKENEKAFKFYVKSGFEQKGEHTYSIGKEVFEFFILTKQLMNER